MSTVYTTLHIVSVVSIFYLMCIIIIGSYSCALTAHDEFRVLHSIYTRRLEYESLFFSCARFLEGEWGALIWMYAMRTAVTYISVAQSALRQEASDSLILAIAPTVGRVLPSPK
jgi:hypothetical protein